MTMAPSTLESSGLASDASPALYKELPSSYSHPLDLGILTTTDNSLIETTDNCMIAHDCNVNAVAILCARIAESVINDFDANDGIAGSDAGA